MYLVFNLTGPMCQANYGEKSAQLNCRLVNDYMHLTYSSLHGIHPASTLGKSLKTHLISVFLIQGKGHSYVTYITINTRYLSSSRRHIFFFNYRTVRNIASQPGEKNSIIW
jgi:hypothetical protein